MVRVPLGVGKRAVLRVTQDRAGFDRLDAWLASQAEPIGRITMESSGHYWRPLAAHLREAGRAVRVVNPLGAKYFAKSRLARTKSDPADARCLALMASTTGRSPATRSRVWSCARRRASR